jgi:hypothetical protein
MPSPVQIMLDLKEIAKVWQVLAILWHIYVGVLIILLLVGIRPRKGLMGILLALPLLSVSFIACAYGNPLDGVLFILAAISLFSVSVMMPKEPVRLAPFWLFIPGLALSVLGWAYPHSLESALSWSYLYATPLGTVPYPTLSILIGVSMMVGCFGSRGWPLVLGITGVFYGLIGILHLGVRVDSILLAGSIGIIIAGFIKRTVLRSELLAE